MVVAYGWVWKRAGEKGRTWLEWGLAAVDADAWEAMNNLAWMALEEGRVEEARAWMDRAMEHEAARESAGARDTEEAVKAVETRERENSGIPVLQSCSWELHRGGVRGGLLFRPYPEFHLFDDLQNR